MATTACPICKDPWTKKVSNSENNPNRVYNTCDNCFVEKPGEWWCWDGDKPTGIKVSSVRKAMAKREREENPEEPPPAKKQRKVPLVEPDSVGVLPRSATDITLEHHETALAELKEIMLRIEEMLKKEYQ